MSTAKSQKTRKKSTKCLVFSLLGIFLGRRTKKHPEIAALLPFYPETTISLIMNRKKHINKPNKTKRGTAPTAKPKLAPQKGQKLRLDDSLDTIFGSHAVYEAFKNPERRHKTLFATQNAIVKLKENVPVSKVDEIILTSEEISRLLGADQVHQGLVLQTTPLKENHVDEIADEKLILILDQVTDPHNIGAIMRSACAFGARYIIMTDRHTPKDNMTTTKSASGAREYIRPIRVTNLARTIEEIKEMGFIVLGLDSQAENDLATSHIRKLYADTPTALIMGAEGKGLRRLTREKCDLLVRINASGPIVSLNVSNAAALALYELSRESAN